MALSELQIETQILDWLSYKQNVIAWKQHTAGVFNTRTQKFRALRGHERRGLSDIGGLLSPTGQTIAIEVKSEKGMLEYLAQKNRHVIEQKAHLDDVERMGGIAFCTCSLDHVQQEFKGIL